MPPPLPSVSVVVPALDEGQWLPALLERLGRGGGTPSPLDDKGDDKGDDWGDDWGDDRPDEVVVVDGGSRDRTRAAALEAGAVLIEAPAGRGSQLGAGARRARGDVIVFLHADTRPAPGAIAAVRRAFVDSRVVATGMRQRIEGSRRFFRWVERAADLRVRLGRVYGDSGLAVRRDVYERIGGFRADLPIFEDLELSRRLRRAGSIRLVTDAVLSVSPRRWEEEGALRRTLRNWAITAAWAAGVDPARLARYYRPHSALAEGP